MKNAPLRLNQGETFVWPFYWYEGDDVIVPITAIAETFPSGFPPAVTAAAHGLPANAIPARLVGILGPTDMNTATDETDPAYRRYVKKVTTDTFNVPGLYATGLDAYEGGGFLVFTPPKDLTGFEARLQVRKSVGAAGDPLLEFTTSGGGGLVITALEGLTTLTVDADALVGLAWRAAVYQLELYFPGTPDVVKRLAGGTFIIDPEATRP
jgi:hypothetical protein